MTVPAKLPVKTALESMDSDQVRREVRALVGQRWPSLQRTVNGDYELTGFRLMSPITEEQRQEILSLSRGLTKTSDPEMVAQEVGRCLTATKSRPKDQTDIKLLIVVLTDELSKYPADLVVTSLRRWSETQPWWPALSEIVQPIKREMGWRLSLATAANTRLEAPEEQSNPGTRELGPIAQRRLDEVRAKLKAESKADRPRPVTLPDVTVPMPRPEAEGAA